MSEPLTMLPVDDVRMFACGQVVPLIYGPYLDERTGYVRAAEERRARVWFIDENESTRCIGVRWL
jgi:hypothetical protein